MRLLRIYRRSLAAAVANSISRAASRRQACDSRSSKASSGAINPTIFLEAAKFTTYPYGLALQGTNRAMNSPSTEQLAYPECRIRASRSKFILGGPGLMKHADGGPNTPPAPSKFQEDPPAGSRPSADSKVPLRRKMGTGLGRRPTPHLFLASDEANFITGVTLPVGTGGSYPYGRA